jgi:hypothetical protein
MWNHCRKCDVYFQNAKCPACAQRRRTILLPGFAVIAVLLATSLSAWCCISLFQHKDAVDNGRKIDESNAKAREEMVRNLGRDLKPFDDRPKQDGDPLKPPVQGVSRSDFRKLVIGRTRNVVRDLIGLPETTAGTADVQFWTYRRCTYDPMTGKMDLAVSITFDQDVAIEVIYFQ